METKISTSDLNLYYGNNHALKNINLDIYENQITAFIGPSGCGKSTYLKTLNRMNDLVPNVTINGKVWIDGEDIYDPKVDTTLLRKKVGMVFQQPNPFPMSIYDNIAYGPRIHGIKGKAELDAIVEKSLRGAAAGRDVRIVAGLRPVHGARHRHVLSAVSALYLRSHGTRDGQGVHPRLV